MKRGAGILPVCFNDGTIFLVQRSMHVKFSLHWSVVGGMIEPNEEPYNAAIRECLEELKILPKFDVLIGTTEFIDNNFHYTTFIYSVSLQEKEKWNPQLNWENDDYGWFSINKLPGRLHPGLIWTLEQTI